MNAIVRALKIAWASPYSILGLLIGAVGLCTRGRARVCRGVVEFYGGFVRWFVRHLPPGEGTLAFTLGHTILGQTGESLDLARDHEHVHVRQYERWGPLMGPAYLLASLYCWLRGRNSYYDNPFEREAYGEASIDEP
jgi:hypothetical protein